MRISSLWGVERQTGRLGYLSGDLWESNCEKWFGVADISFSKCSVWSELAVDASGTNSPSMAQWCLFLPSGQKIAGDCQNTKKN